ncbi:class I SAM-dependent methyltransferase [Polynucleobacter duraquae]|nr:class I SAM-dependent methyltransferase [Polynucleobacter duraquae]
MNKYKVATNCRICGNANLVPILDLGEQMLTGVFPKKNDPLVATVGPLRLVKCMGEDSVCGLVQLAHSYNLSEMYGLNYGYRSGLNKSMVAHLHAKVDRILSLVNLSKGDLVIDIGSNDGTTLAAYPNHGLNLVGIDPTGIKFKPYYQDHIQLISDFFSSDLIEKSFPNKKASVITSFSMFYDLEDPIDFMKNIYSVLADDGIWIFEQSYLPTMIETNSFDTVCHEHLEFYCLNQIQFMAEKVGFQIVDVEFNDINGGSFSVTVQKSKISQNILPSIQAILKSEEEQGYNSLAPFIAFEKRTKGAKQALIDFLNNAKKEGKTVAALGASTKGNVLLQFCQITPNDITCVGEVNDEKFGCFTPGTWLPIISEDEMLNQKPDYLLVLPWHFKKFFIGNSKFAKSKLVFPLPTLEIVDYIASCK